MTKLELGRLAQETLDLQAWRLNARAPGNIVLTRRVEGGEDTLFLHPYRGVYSLSFGHCVSGKRTYDRVSNVLASAIPAGSPPYDESSFQVVSRQVTDMLFAEITQPSDFEPWLPTARAMVHEDVLPELERYRYLGPLHERIAATEDAMMSQFMPSPFHAHIMIIKRLIDDPSWEDYAIYWTNFYDDYARTPEGAHAKANSALITNLHSMLPGISPLTIDQIWGAAGKQ